MTNDQWTVENIVALRERVYQLEAYVTLLTAALRSVPTFAPATPTIHQLPDC